MQARIASRCGLVVFSTINGIAPGFQGGPCLLPTHMKVLRFEAAFRTPFKGISVVTTPIDLNIGANGLLGPP